MKKSNPMKLTAGQKAAATRKKNAKALAIKLSNAGKKAWKTRRANALA